MLLFIRDITEGKPLVLEVTGIEYMNDDPAMVDVLYAKVKVKDRSDKSVHQKRIKYMSSSSPQYFKVLSLCLNLCFTILFGYYPTVGCR